MPRRRNTWDDRWHRFPTSTPRPTEDGIATRKQRGKMADTWWSNRLVELLDSYGLGSRMQRGRRYARQGQLTAFDVEPGRVTARVQGSRAAPYAVRVDFPELTDRQWDAVQHEIESRLQFPARLLAGEVPPELEAVFADAGVPLLPRRWYDLHAVCTCPDPEVPCKHIAATLYVLADRLDDDPWLLLTWRGRDRDELLAHLGSTADDRAAVAPWWPLVPGAPLPIDSGVTDAWVGGDPGAALARLGPLDIAVRDRPITELLAGAYPHLTLDDT